MKTAKVISKIIAKAGRELLLEKEDAQKPFQAYLNPVCNKGDLLEPTEGGRWDKGCWLLLCPINAVTKSIAAGDIISCKEGKFCVESLRKICWGNKEAHIWGIAVAVAENEEVGN